MALDVTVTTPEVATSLPPLLFIHGAWHANWVWDEHFTGFFARRGYPSYAVSLRGHGASTGSLKTSRIAHYVADVRRVATELEQEPILIGHSMGGFVVQHYLMRYPARAAVLMATVPSAGALGATLRVARHHPMAFARANATLSLGPIVDDADRAAALLFCDSSDPIPTAEYCARLQDESYLAYLEMIADLPNQYGVDAPVLVVGASDDGIFTPDEMRRTARRYGNEAVIVPDMGHDMMLERRWDEPAAIIAEWLDHVVSDQTGRIGT